MAKSADEAKTQAAKKAAKDKAREQRRAAASKGSVKVVPSTPDIHRKSLNAMEQTRVNITKSGSLAKGTAAPIEAKNAKGITPKETVSIRSNAGISGAGGAKVGQIYKPMGGSGMGLLSIKNR